MPYPYFPPAAKAPSSSSRDFRHAFPLIQHAPPVFLSRRHRHHFSGLRVRQTRRPEIVEAHTGEDTPSPLIRRRIHRRPLREDIFPSQDHPREIPDHPGRRRHCACRVLVDSKPELIRPARPRPIQSLFIPPHRTAGTIPDVPGTRTGWNGRRCLQLELPPAAIGPAPDPAIPISIACTPVPPAAMSTGTVRCAPGNDCPCRGFSYNARAYVEYPEAVSV